MDPSRSPYELCLCRVEQKLGQADAAFEMVKQLVKSGQRESAYSLSFHLAREVESLVLLARELPAYTGNPQAAAISERILSETVPIQIGFTPHGWFSVSMPMLLPKKSQGSPEYIRSILYPAMRRFFHGREPICYPNCVVIFRHVYHRARPERRQRDHDNIEVNAVTNILALYVMKDDSALHCSHFYCSVPGDRDRTEVYVVHRDEFIEWLVEQKYFPEAGIKLLPNYP